MKIIVKVNDSNSSGGGDPPCNGSIANTITARYVAPAPIRWTNQRAGVRVKAVRCGANFCKLNYVGAANAPGANITLTGFTYESSLNGNGFIQLVRQHASGSVDVLFSIFAKSTATRRVTLPPLSFRVLNLLTNDTIFIRWVPQITGAAVTVVRTGATLAVSCA